MKTKKVMKSLNFWDYKKKFFNYKYFCGDDIILPNFQNTERENSQKVKIAEISIS